MNDIVSRMRPAEISELVLAIIQGDVYFTIDPEDAAMSFGLVLLYHINEWSMEYCQTIGALWAHRDAELPFSIGGHPAFSEVNAVNVDDVPLILDRLVAAVASLEAGVQENRA